ncbi:MAG: hypothetical protein KF784_07265 [Fimbriimonadaceae bacterium]|nr:hypothetical protein [Fimbriimonadaceae bacterium]
MDRGIKALHNYEYEEANRIGDRLIKRRFTGGYEVKARALAADDRTQEAIVILRAGLDLAPTNYILWSYLGEYESNLGNHQEAIAAFRRHEMLGGGTFWSHLNIGMIYGRMGEYDLGFQFIDGLEPDSEEDELTKTKSRAWLMVHTEQYADLNALCKQALLRFPDCAELYGYAAVARFEHDDSVQARDYALEALARDKTDNLASQVLRALHGVESPGSRCFEILVEGVREFERRPGRVERLGFFAVYFVKAVDEDAALDFVGPFEPRAQGSLAVAKAVATGEKVEGPDGVYRARGGYSFYTLD